ncbi:hypothetical protein LWC34_14655 [Kibdelosporangium philippinense]|uniref:Uncharacterized protein n=1 Tax=Kibdelosporangium philippinense TaxID=211113 RepID=A0ABS8ZAK1_9PSEU|nr:hypothetical protein [Kibdelosporangium philippinense]MCE7004063.1 hypothetical protein [Kibdelosporangium philippinense]
MPEAMSLAEFTAALTPLTAAQRVAIVDRALLQFGHTDAVHRLRSLRSFVRHMTDERAFHREMAGVHRSMGQTYLLPEPYASRFAYLPFRLERTATSEYLVTRVVSGYTALQPGTQVTHWNGTPIAWAVALIGAQAACPDAAASLARGLDCLTLRPLLTWLPPGDDTVAMTCLSPDGAVRSLRVPWRVGEIPAPATARQDIDHDADARLRARKLLFRPDVVAAEGGHTATRLAKPVALTTGDIPTHMPGVLRARVVGRAGHLRIYTFHVPDPIALHTEIDRLLALLPPLTAIDVRGAGGTLNTANILIDDRAEEVLTRRDLLAANEDLLAQLNTGTNATANRP